MMMRQRSAQLLGSTPKDAYHSERGQQTSTKQRTAETQTPPIELRNGSIPSLQHITREDISDDLEAQVAAAIAADEITLLKLIAILTVRKQVK